MHAKFVGESCHQIKHEFVVRKRCVIRIRILCNLHKRNSNFWRSRVPRRGPELPCTTTLRSATKLREMESAAWIDTISVLLAKGRARVGVADAATDWPRRIRDMQYLDHESLEAGA